MPIRARIALASAGVAAATVLLLSLLVYALAANAVGAQQDRELVRRGHEAAAELQRAGPEPTGGWRSPAPTDLAASADTFVELLTPEGRPAFSTGVVAGSAPDIPRDVVGAAASRGSAVGTLVAPDGTQLRVYVQALGAPSGGGYVVAGQATRPLQAQVRGLRSFLILSALLTLVGALGASWWTAGRALRPLKAMAGTVDDIGRTHDLSRRLPKSERRDEVGRLANSFNGMLERIDEAHARLAAALDAQKRFVADASHELRTPLTSIRNNVGFLLVRRDADEADREAALRDVADESERMARLIDDLLALARADSGQRLELATLDLLPLVERVCEQARRLHPTRDLALLPSRGATIEGNADALTRLLWILLDNAVKFTREGGHVWIRLSTTPDATVVTVADDGTGIPEGDLETIFERFYQADPSRSGHGTGLGLAIARWIAGEHGGDLRATNNDSGGATFRLTLPSRCEGDSSPAGSGVGLWQGPPRQARR